MVEVTINGRKHEVHRGITVLEACKKIGIDIPTLCYDDRLEPYEACRLCVVEEKGKDSLQTACSLKVRKGMEIETHSPMVIEARKNILDLLISNHPEDCLTCEKSGDCSLQDYCYEYGVPRGTFIGEKKNYPIDDSNYFYTYDPNKCILCGRCVRVCSELQGTDAIGLGGKGFDTKVVPLSGKDLATSKCVSCGNCVAVCPVGALMPKRKEKIRNWEIKRTKTTCSYCGVGCQMDILAKGEKVVGIEPARALANNGLLCVKGRFAYPFINHPDRLKTPLIKRNGKFEEATWEEAYGEIKSKMTSIKDEFGGEAFAGLTSARCTNEENYLFQKLFRAVIGTNNVDHCARL